MRAPQAPLEIHANNFSPLAEVEAAERHLDQRKQRQTRRLTRHQARAVCWACSSLDRVRKCGRIPNGQGVTLRLGNGVAGVAGVTTCGSVWSCPVCSSKILVRRALEVGTVLGGAQAEGLSLAFGTLTMRHRKGQSLRELWSAGAKAWNRATAGKAWLSAQRRSGLVGWVRVWEVTEGANGWHVHVHFVLVLDGQVQAVTLDDVCDGMFTRWSKGLEAAGLETPLRKGQEWHLVGGDGQEVAQYLTKLAEGSLSASDALGLELTHVQAGRSRSTLRTRPVWQLLQESQDTGEVGRWREWEQASKGKRQIGWSKGLRERFGLDVEQTDEAIAAEELGSADDDLVFFDTPAWLALVSQWWRLPQLLDAAENGGLRAVRTMLDGWGDVPYSIVSEGDDDQA